LEIPAFEVVPELRRIAERAAEIADGRVRMTGSGSALFRLFDDEVEARQFALAAASALSVRTEVARLAVGG
jgi:4-diphosphocytidyl-2C-methyl-D-erythritol kinase